MFPTVTLESGLDAACGEWKCEVCVGVQRSWCEGAVYECRQDGVVTMRAI